MPRKSFVNLNAPIDEAITAGDSEAGERMNVGFVFGLSVDDPDGHICKRIGMDPSHIRQS